MTLLKPASRGGAHWPLWSCLLALTATLSLPACPARAAIAPGCDTNTLTSYSAGFDAADFSLISVSVDADGHLFLETGNQAIDPNRIVIPFEQEVSVTFLYEGAGYQQSDFGWLTSHQGAAGPRHEIYQNVNDNNNNGVLDDREGIDANGDGVVDARDNRVFLDKFAAGDELVFYLKVDDEDGAIFYTRKDWNPDTWQGGCAGDRLTKTYLLGVPMLEGGCSERKGWLNSAALTRLDRTFGLGFADTDRQSLDVARGEPFDHVIVGAPTSRPNEWILGWEDLGGGGDTDHNDLVFQIERRNGGSARLDPTRPISPANQSSYYTAVTFEVYDYTPDGECSGQTEIRYYVSINNGADWVEITDWDKIQSYTVGPNGGKTLGPPVDSWSPGAPARSYRSARIDFSGLGRSGRELTWKAELLSNEESCAPEILDVNLEGSVATHAFFSRAAPVALANVLYSGSFETPDRGWLNEEPRGHLRATRLYDPHTPNRTDTVELWDAGEKLSRLSPGHRTIFIPGISASEFGKDAQGKDLPASLLVTRPDGSLTSTGDGVTTHFRGQLRHHPILATTLRIRINGKEFTDAHNGILKSHWGHGTINRFTGKFELFFDQPPPENMPFTVSYTYYRTAGLEPFTTDNPRIDNRVLALDDTRVSGRYLFDFDGNGRLDDDEGDWLIDWVRGYENGDAASPVPKAWKLGSVDHSVPALLTSPGMPAWVFGTDITNEERESYRAFRDGHKDRRTVLFVGARDGMLHAFDAGNFRWGNNPQTPDIEERRGYFHWEDPTGSGTIEPNYGSGQELWAFIPANLVPRLKNNLLQAEDRAYVDASPALADVFIDGGWKSVLLAAEGNGGDTVFCLDVTDPTSPRFLWEFADPELFRSRSSPSVGQIGRIIDDGTVKWAAFFVSGKTGAPGSYPSIYVLDVANGNRIAKIPLDSDNGGIGGVPSGEPALIDSDGNGYIDRIYIGTDKGRLYKVVLSDDPEARWHQIDDCVINTDYTDNTFGSEIAFDQRWHPIYASPAVVVDNGLTDSGELDYNLRVFFGTGDSPYFDEDIDTGNTTYHFFAYNDKAAKGVCNPEAVELDWYYALPAGQRIFASAFAGAGQIYFGTSSAETENPCDGENTGKLYAFKTTGYQRGQPAQPEFTKDTGDVNTSPLVFDQHLYVRTPGSTVQIGAGGFNNETKTGGIGKARTRAWKTVME